MKSYDRIIEFYSLSGYEAFSSFHNNSYDWGDKGLARKFLEKYGLSEDDFESNVKDLLKSIFNTEKKLPEMIFKQDFEFISLLGGVMFEEEEFEKFDTSLKTLGENRFVIIQDNIGLKTVESLMVEFPVGVTWDLLMTGNFISTVLFEFYPNDYYLFGDSGEWGMYVANTYIDENVNPAGTPIRILGFNPKYRDLFRKTFNISAAKYSEDVEHIPIEERPNLKDWVPALYRNERFS